MKRFLLLALTAELLSPIAAKAEISEEIHKLCLDARDYSGGVRTNQRSSHKLKKEMTGICLFLNMCLSKRKGFDTFA